VKRRASASVNNSGSVTVFQAGRKVAATSADDLDYRTDAAGAASRAGEAAAKEEEEEGAPSSGGGAPLFSARARMLFAATGLLGTPSYPTSIAGLLGAGAAFTGPVFHSARWDWSAPLGGRRVAVVGAGASAAQVVPALADPALGIRSLTLCLRSAPTVIPKGNNDQPVSGAYKALYARSPTLRKAVRAVEWARAAFIAREMDVNFS
jgi:cation diffusion facilitator CzcD-associated flavoprotein CzcO